MVKNKNIGGCHIRSSTYKKKKAGSQTANNKDLALLDYPADSNIPAVSQELQTTGQGQLGFPDRVYLLASVIFQNNHLEKPAAYQLVSYGKQRGLPLPKVKGEEMQRSAYELAFSTLKCECVSLLVPSYISSYLFRFSLAHFFYRPGMHQSNTESGYYLDSFSKELLTIYFKMQVQVPRSGCIYVSPITPYFEKVWSSVTVMVQFYQLSYETTIAMCSIMTVPGLNFEKLPQRIMTIISVGWCQIF